MTDVLAGRGIAILATDGVEELELTEPRRVLDEAGATLASLAPTGGVASAGKLRSDAAAAIFTRGVMSFGTQAGAICDGLWILIETGLLTGRTVTSYPTLRTDLVNAGARRVDEEVHNDGGLVTSRRVAGVPAVIAGSGGSPKVCIRGV